MPFSQAFRGVEWPIAKWNPPTITEVDVADNVSNSVLDADVRHSVRTLDFASIIEGLGESVSETTACAPMERRASIA